MGMIEKKGLTVGRLAMLLGKPGTDEIMLARIEFALDNAKEIALNYCHIEEIPEGLETTVLRMAMDIYRNEKPGEEDAPRAVSSVQMGDTTTVFGALSTGFSDSLMKNYKASLNRYRKVVFT